MSKKHNILFWIVSIILCTGLFFLYQRFDITKKNNSHNITKIVTLIPSVQEIVSYIGGEHLIVGVSQHSAWPESIKNKEKIAGFSGVDYERLSKLAPDIVIDSGMVKEASEKLGKMGIKYIQLKENSVQDILDSMLILGKELGLEKNAQKKVDEIKSAIDKIRAEDDKGHKMLITVGHSDELKNLYIAGKDNLFDELISLAGFVNGYEGQIMYP
jgi:ABC-type Fe3+-hydroxamate transport system substrate-binding protein